MSENFEPLLEAARSGDEHAFRALVEPLDRELHAYAYRMLGPAVLEARPEDGAVRSHTDDAPPQ